MNLMEFDRSFVQQRTKSRCERCVLSNSGTRCGRGVRSRKMNCAKERRC